MMAVGRTPIGENHQVCSRTLAEIAIAARSPPERYMIGRALKRKFAGAAGDRCLLPHFGGVIIPVKNRRWR